MSLVRAIATCVNDLWGVCVVLSMIHSSRLLADFCIPSLVTTISLFISKPMGFPPGHSIFSLSPSRWPLGVIYCFPCELSFCLVPSCRRRPSASQRKHLITPSHNSWRCFIHQAFGFLENDWLLLKLSLSLSLSPLQDAWRTSDAKALPRISS